MKKPKIIVDDFNNVFINGKKAKHMSHTGGIQSGRHCYTDGKIIVKLNDEGNQSRQEIRLYKKINKKDKKYFGVIVNYDSSKNGWVAVIKEELKRGRRTDREREIIIEMMLKYNLNDLWIPTPVNWGVRKSDNCPFIYDFAR